MMAASAMVFVSGCSVVDRSVHYDTNTTCPENNSTCPECNTTTCPETNTTTCPECNTTTCPETNTTTCPECNATDVNVTVASSAIRIVLDQDEKTKIIDWKSSVSAQVQDSGEIPAQIKQQTQYGMLALDGDRMLYLVQEDGNMTDYGVLHLGSGNGAVDINVTIVRHYWREISVGMYYTLAIRDDGTLWGWGSNAYGQLGDGTRIDRDAPVQIGTDDTWSHAYAGYFHSFGIKNDGTLWGWGRNNVGQLGQGNRADQDHPVQEPSGDTKWTGVALGYYFTAAIKSDGTLWTTGNNAYGQLADGTTTRRYTFTDVTPAGTTWEQIAAGIYYWLALRSDKTLWACGRNNYGQLGDGTTTSRNVLTQEASGDSDWQSIAAGENHALAIKSDGRLFGWGYNRNYQIGDGTATSHSTPTQEASAATNWVAVSAGSYHTAALKSDGTLWGWGANNYGQLGDRLNVTRYGPNLIDDTHTWKQLAVGRYQTSTLSPKAVLWTWGTTTGTKEGSTK